MEISASELESVKNMIHVWLQTSDVELEATFGAGGRVSVETFLRVAKRLSSLGYEAEVQPDKLNILLRNQIRLSLENFGVVQEYCRDNRAFGKPLTVMKKDSAPGVIITEKLDDYDVLIKTRRELPQAYNETKMEECSMELQQAFAQWDSQPKSFRLMKRWSYMKDGVRFDLSMVRSNKRDEAGKYRWVRSFQDEDVLRNEPTYEIEVELDRAYFMAQENSEGAALKAFSASVGHVLRGIQNNSRLIKKSTVGKIRQSYESLVRTKLFRGVKPFVLSVGNMQSAPLEEFKGASIREGYNVTDKADGLRMHGYFDDGGLFYMIDMDMSVYRTDYRCKKLAKTLLDGEWVSQGKATEEGGPRPMLNNLYIFDIYYYKGADVSQKPFYRGEGDVEDTRYEILKKCMAVLESADTERPSGAKPLLISMKNFYFAEKKVSIFQRASSILDLADTMIYDTDGLIFTSNKAPLPSDPQGIFDEQFKWKPAAENTIDFLVKFEKDEDGSEKVQSMIREDTNERVLYKTLRLYIASKSDNEWKDPRSTILNKIPIPPRDELKLHPVIFSPEDYPSTLASVCYIRVEEDPETHEIYGLTTDSEEPIRDNSIVEMRYDPQQEEGWRWIPLVNRADKTQKFDRGIIRGTMNTSQNANVVWNSIHNPVTEHMIRTGDDRPSLEEQRALAHITAGGRVAARYYDRTAGKEDLQIIEGLREFHKQFIKRKILYSVLKKRGTETYKTLVDTSVGRATDIHNWIHNKVDFVLGIDYAGENIRTADSGAYARYMNILSNPRMSKELKPPMVFVIGDSSKSYVDGDAGETPEEADMLRAIFGLHAPAGALPKFVEDHAVGRLRDGTDVMSSMYALHYFFESREKFDGFLDNVDKALKVGGYFIGTCFDGDTLMRNSEFMKKKNGESIIGVDGKVELWSIVKRYDNEKLLDRTNPDAIFGNAIDVKFLSIGEEHTEYLMNYEYLKQRMAEIGIEPLSETECAALGVPAASQMYRDSHELAESKGEKYVMNDAVKRFSYLNRWFIFKRKTKRVAEVEGEEAAVVGPAGPATENCRVAFKISPQSDREDERYMDYGTQFKPAIPDPDDPSTLYPSIKHFLAGMLFKRSSNKPEFAKQYFSTIGAVHTKYEDKREDESRLTAYTNARKAEITAELEEERAAVEKKYETLRKKEKTLTDEKKKEFASKEAAEQDAVVKKYKEIVKKEKASTRLTPARRLELEAAENKEVEETLRKFRIKKNMEKFGLTYAEEDEIRAERDEALRYAVDRRYASDEKFKAVADRLRNENKYILYHVKEEGNDLGGVCLADGTIVGVNKYGKALMAVAQIAF
jgi:hypothetical protein